MIEIQGGERSGKAQALMDIVRARITPNSNICYVGPFGHQDWPEPTEMSGEGTSKRRKTMVRGVTEQTDALVKRMWQTEHDKTAQLRDVLRERDEVFARCEKLEAERDWARIVGTDYRRLFSERRERCKKAEAERDEARQWAAKYGRENAKLHKFIELWKVEELLWDSERDEARAQSAIDNVRMVGMADEIDDLRAQLAEARNKALEKASIAVRKALFIRDIPSETIHHVCFIINRLKEAS